MRKMISPTLILSILAIGTLSACGGSTSGTRTPGTTAQADITPDIPSLISPDQKSQAGTEVTQSFTVAGINQPVDISIKGGEYAIDDGAFTNRPNTVTAGQIVTVRVDSSTTFGETNSAIVTVGGKAVTVSVVTEDEDLKPDDISFTPAIDIAPGGEVLTDSVTISGINTKVPISISAGQYSIDDGHFTSEPGSISPGQRIRLRVSASDELTTETKTILNIGEMSTELSVTTENADLYPDALEFRPRDNVAVGTTITTERLTVTGINTVAPISISQGEYSIDRGNFTSEPGTIFSGQKVQVRVSASNSFLTEEVAVLSVGDGDSLIRVTTEDEDLEPNLITFTPAINLTKGEVTLSNEVEVAGINTATTVKIEGGFYSINGGDFTQGEGFIENGQQLQIQATASTEWEGQVEVKLTVGTSQTTWLLTTMIENIPPQASILFPWPNSLTTDEHIVARGLATDNTAIERVVVNGVEASLGEAVDIEGGINIEWQAQIANNSANQDIIVDVYDTKGNFTENAASTTIQKTYELPGHVAHIEEGQRILGDSGLHIDIIDLAADIKQSIRMDMVGSGCYYASRDEYFYMQATDADANSRQWVGESEMRLAIKSYSFAAEHSTVWGSFTAAAPQGDSVIFIDELTLHCDETNNQILAVSNLNKTSNDHIAQIHQLVLSNTPEIITALTTGDMYYEDWTATMSSLDKGTLVTLSEPDEGLISIFDSSNLNNEDDDEEEKEDENTISNELSNVQGLTVDADAGLTHLALNEGIYTYAHSTGNLSELSIVEPSDPLYFDQAYNFVRGSEGNFFIRDITKDMLIRIDRDSGERSEYLAPETVGEGERLVSTAEMVTENESNTAYVLDIVAGRSARLVEIDLDQGNRRLITSIDSTDRIDNSALALNETAKVLYVGLNDALYEVSIETGASTLLASSTLGTGYTYAGIDGMIYKEDQDVSELYIADRDTAAIFAVELTNGNERRLVSHSSVGDGPTLSGVNGVVMVGETLYASVTGTNSVYSITLETGNREAIPLDECISSSGDVRDLSNSFAYGIRYNPIDNWLVLPGWATRGVDLETEQCLFISGFSFLDIQASKDAGLYFTIDINAVEYWDAKTSAVVTLSR